MLGRKCKNKTENLAEKRPGSLPVMGKSENNDLLKWALDIQKQGLPVGWEMIIHKAS